MNGRQSYKPGRAAGAQIREEGENWTLILVRELRHAPEKVWQALTDPKELREWAPFDADRSLGSVGQVNLSTVGSPAAVTSLSRVSRAERPVLLEYQWGDGDLRWQLEPLGDGTRLTLWHNIERGFITWGAAGWHICLDVLAQLLTGKPIGRIVGMEAMQFDWQRLVKEYAEQFGVEPPSWPPKARDT